MFLLTLNMNIVTDNFSVIRCLFESFALKCPSIKREMTIMPLE